MAAATANPTQAQLQSMITSAATSAGIPPALALAVAQTESNFNPNATASNSNGTTDYGVMQINSSNLTSLGLTDPLDPQANIDAGVSLLANLYSQYGGNLQQTLWAYNAGPGAVSSGNLPASTASYISTVQGNMANYSSTVPDLTPDLDSSDTSDASLTDFLTGDVTIGGLDLSGTTAVVGGIILLGLVAYMLRR